MELVLYYITEGKSLLISFLILTFVLGIFAYMAMRNFRQDKKSKVFFYGLFLGLKNMDILKLSTVVIKSFLVVYATIVLEDTLMWMCLIMITILTVIYIICEHRRVIYELVCSSLQIVMIYFIYTLNNYMIEIENTSLILMIRTCLIVMVIILTAYLFFRDIALIAEDRMNKSIKKAKQAKEKKEAEETEKVTKGMD